MLRTPAVVLPVFALILAGWLVRRMVGCRLVLLAEFHDREADSTSRVVLASTVASVVTVSAYLASGM